MVCFTNFSVKIPKNNITNFNHHVMKKIYDVNLQFENNTIINPTPAYLYKLGEETEDYYTVTFRNPSTISIINVMPKTIKNPNKTFFDDKCLIDKIKHKIDREIYCSEYDMCIIEQNEEPLTSSPNNFPLIINQLANEEIIDNYMSLGDEKYLCSKGYITLILRLENLNIDVSDTRYYTFDYDDGFIYNDPFSGECRVIEGKNQDIFLKWKEVGDITLPILPSNDLTIL